VETNLTRLKRVVDVRFMIAPGQGGDSTADRMTLEERRAPAVKGGRAAAAHMARKETNHT
jgi:hypothetical protein